MSNSNASVNYGGRILDNQQGIKQFFVSDSGANTWTYKRQTGGLAMNGLLSLTPANNKTPVLIDNDLTVTGSIFNTSDERLKENISNISVDEIDRLMLVKPKQFLYKNRFDKRVHYGFLAQDIEKIYPNLVDNNASNYKRVNYQEFIPLILSKMQNMQNEIDELKRCTK